MPSPAAAYVVVACNIYITAAASQSSTLLSLLRRAQDQCRQLRHSDDEMAPVAIIHAYADIPYDRSSFHLAGRPEYVCDVASKLVCNALSEIDLDCMGENTESRHPFVGLVDHVSVMPVSCTMSNNGKHKEKYSQCEAAAKVAREIGNKLSNTNLVNAYYYGMACPENTPLATVRRERTSFFKSGGSIDNKKMTRDKHTPSKETRKVALKGDVTIGAPPHFVENFNIRLTSKVNFDQAKLLTQFLRGRNIVPRGYGVAGVEALTLPYVRGPTTGGSVYEVACNLTTPKEGGVDDIQVQLKKWIERQRHQLSGDESLATDNEPNHHFDYRYFVEEAYQVGTTEDQCMRILLEQKSNIEYASSDTFWEEYDKQVFSKFQETLR